MAEFDPQLISHYGFTPENTQAILQSDPGLKDAWGTSVEQINAFKSRLTGVASRLGYNIPSPLIGYKTGGSGSGSDYVSRLGSGNSNGSGGYSRMDQYSDTEKRLRDSLLNIQEPNEQSIFDEKMRQAQSTIDLIREQYGKIINEEKAAGASRNARTRALNVGSGLAGSDFASANAIQTDQYNQKILDQVYREQAAAVSKVLDDVKSRASDEFKTAKQDYLDRAEKGLASIEEFRTKTRETVYNNVASVAGLGVSADQFKSENPDAYAQLLDELKSVGGNEFDLKYQFVANQPKGTKIGEETVGNKKIFFFQDPGGKISQQTVELPTGEGLGATEDIIDDGYGNPIIVTYAGEKGKSKITGVRTISGIPQKTGSSGSGSGGGFTTTQLNVGAARAGMGLAEFRALPADVQNIYINGDIAGAKKDIDSQLADGASPEDIASSIDELDLPEEVKQTLRSYTEKSAKDNAPLSTDQIKTRLESSAKDLKAQGYSRSEAKTSILDALSDNGKITIPKTQKSAVEDILVNIYGRTFFQKVFPGGR